MLAKTPHATLQRNGDDETKEDVAPTEAQMPRRWDGHGPAGTCGTRCHPAGQVLACSIKPNSTLSLHVRKSVCVPSRHRPQEQEVRSRGEVLLTEISHVSTGALGAPRKAVWYTKTVLHRFKCSVYQAEVHQGLTMSIYTDGGFQWRHIFL